MANNKPIKNERAEPAADNNQPAQDKASIKDRVVESPRKDKEADSVSIPRETLSQILARLETLEKSDQDKDKEIERLTNVADKGRLMRYDSKSQPGALIRKARVSFWDGHPVLAWQKVKDEVGFRNGQLVVSQIIRLFLDSVDPESKALKTVDVEYLHWAQNTQSVSGEVVEKTETDSNVYWTIQLGDGRRVKLDVRFINAF